MAFLLRELEEKDREETISLVHQFFRLVNGLTLDGVFRIRPRAAAKFTDIYLKLRETGKVYMKGVFSDGELVSLLIGRIEEKPHLEEGHSLYIDLAVTKLGRQKQGFMKALLQDVEAWCQEKEIPSMELRALVANAPALEFWDSTGFERFYVRYRKIVTARPKSP